MTLQSGNQVSTSLGNSGLCWTVLARNRDTTVPAEGNGDLQTLICVLVARPSLPRRCFTLSNPVPWQNWMAAYLLMKTLFRGWPVMVNDTHTRRRMAIPAHIDLLIMWRSTNVILGLTALIVVAVKVPNIYQQSNITEPVVRHRK